MTDPQAIDAPRPNHSTGPTSFQILRPTPIVTDSPANSTSSPPTSSGPTTPTARSPSPASPPPGTSSAPFPRTRHIPADTGAPQVDEAFAQTHTWARESRNLELLTIYEQRIQRSIDTNMSRLEALRTRREPEAYFSTAPIARESVFSNPEVAPEFKVAKASAGESAPSASLKGPHGVASEAPRAV